MAGKTVSGNLEVVQPDCAGIGTRASPRFLFGCCSCYRCAMHRTTAVRERVCHGTRSKVGGGRQIVAILAAVAVCCASESRSADESRAKDDAVASGSSGNLERAKEDVERPEHLHVLDATQGDLRGLVEGMRAPAMGSGCDLWADHRSRAGMLVPVPGAVRLFVGEHGDGPRETGDFSVGKVQRKYPVTKFARSGSPYSGEIVIALPKAVAEAERGCVERLRGVRVKWLKWPGEVGDAVAADMVVRDVRFSRAAVVGPAGDAVATGDTVAKLSLAEPWTSMVFREMKAQMWGILGGMVGGLVLAILMGTADRMWRRLKRAKALDRPDDEAAAEDQERGSDEDPVAAIEEVFDRAMAAGYTVKQGHQQIMLFHEGWKVGGWNTRERHWYVSKVIAEGRDDLLLRSGFRWMERPRHQWWQADGEKNADAFVSVVQTLTGSPMRLPGT